MLLVVDASVITHITLSGGAMGPLAGHELLAPALLVSEVTSVLSEMSWRGEIPRDQGKAAVRHLRSLPIRIDRPDDLSERAFDVAQALGWAKTYDADYIALALVHGAPLVTVDERLRRGAGHIVPMLAPHELQTT